MPTFASGCGSFPSVYGEFLVSATAACERAVPWITERPECGADLESSSSASAQGSGSQASGERDGVEGDPPTCTLLLDDVEARANSTAAIASGCNRRASQ